MGQVVRLEPKSAPRNKARPAKNLTSKFAQKAPKPESGQLFYRDANEKRLALRVLPSGSRVWCSNFSHEGRLYRRPLGPIERYTRDDAVNELHKLIGEIKAGRDPLALKRAERDSAKEAERVRQSFEQHTLKRLCELYVTDLQRRGRYSYRDVARIFAVHVDSAPEANRPARDVSPHEIAGMLRRIVDAGKGRTAGKLRAYLRAAYQRAAAARFDPRASKELADLGVETNPVAPTPALTEFNQARERKLLDAELGAILRSLSKDERLAARAARIGVLLGGQRPTQLLRARPADFDEAAGTLTLVDPKGRRPDKPRRNVVPVIGPALPLVKALAKAARDRRSEWLFSGDGHTPMRPEAPYNVVAEISKAMEERAKEGGHPVESFSLKDLRAAVETQLAALRVSKEVRARLLSHGFGGIQDIHYDRHSYLPEKTEALELWHRQIAKLIRKAAKA